MAKHDMTPGIKAMVDRVARAEGDFVEVLMSMGGLGRSEAVRVLAYYRKHRLVKGDAVIGRIDVKHGALLDRDVIQRAAAL